MRSQTALRVEVLKAEWRDGYDDFIRAQPHSLFYHSSVYKEFLQALIACDDHYLVAFEGDEIRGALPLMRTGPASGHIYNSLPFFGTSAGIIAADAAAYDALAGAYNEIATCRQTRSATIVGSQFGPRRDAESLAHNCVDARIAQMTELPPGGDAADVLAAIDGSARRNVAKARHAGITVSVDHGEMARLRELHRAGMQAISGTPKPQAFFDLVPRFFTPSDEFDLYVARRDGRVIAGLLLFYLGRTVEYFMPAVDPPFRPLQPLALVIATAMADAARRRFRWWNWGGTWTTQTGVYRFKKKWGAIERPYAYYTQLNDETLRAVSRAELLQRWPHFFVLPFSQLGDQGA